MTGEEVPSKLVGDESRSENEQGIMWSMGGIAGRSDTCVPGTEGVYLLESDGFHSRGLCICLCRCPVLKGDSIAQMTGCGDAEWILGRLSILTHGC